jgi:hypothetical protein
VPCLEGDMHPVPCLEAPVVSGFGEGARQKTGVFYSNSSAGLEKSTQGVPHTPPSPIFGALLALLMASVGKEVFTFKKILPEDRGKLDRDKGIEDRVSSKI